MANVFYWTLCLETRSLAEPRACCSRLTAWLVSPGDLLASVP